MCSKKLCYTYFTFWIWWQFVSKLKIYGSRTHFLCSIFKSHCSCEGDNLGLIYHIDGDMFIRPDSELPGDYENRWSSWFSLNVVDSILIQPQRLDIGSKCQPPTTPPTPPTNFRACGVLTRTSSWIIIIFIHCSLACFVLFLFISSLGYKP